MNPIVNCSYYNRGYCLRFENNPTLRFCKECPKNTTKKVWPSNIQILEEESQKSEDKNIRHLALIEVFGAIIPILKAKATGVIITPERVEKRAGICMNCSQVAINPNNVPVCGVCGCHLNIQNRNIPDIITLEETKDYGCKHPLGSRWKAAGC